MAAAAAPPTVPVAAVVPLVAQAEQAGSVARLALRAGSVVAGAVATVPAEAGVRTTATTAIAATTASSPAAAAAVVLVPTTLTAASTAAKVPNGEIVITYTQQAVPEPSTLAMLGAAGIGLLVYGGMQEATSESSRRKANANEKSRPK